jgi:hypothetical protein
MGIYNIELRDCKLAGLPEIDAKEGRDYRFHRSGLERFFPEISSSFYAEQRLSLAAAITLLESKPKTSMGKITLSADETETLRRVFQENRILQGKFEEVACRAYGLLAIVDEAGKLYREGKPPAAAKKLGWTLGKGSRRQLRPHADIFSDYLLMIWWSDSAYRKTKEEAVEILVIRYKMSQAAVLKSLQRTFAILRKSHPDISGILPDTWPKEESHRSLSSPKDKSR